MAKKTEVLMLRVDPEFKRSLEYVAAQHDVSMSEAVRMIVAGQVAHSEDIRAGYREFQKNLRLMKAVMAGKSEKMPDGIFKEELEAMRRIIEVTEKRSGRGKKVKRLAES